MSSSPSTAELLLFDVGFRPKAAQFVPLSEADYLNEAFLDQRLLQSGQRRGQVVPIEKLPAGMTDAAADPGGRRAEAWQRLRRDFEVLASRLGQVAGSSHLVRGALSEGQVSTCASAAYTGCVRKTARTEERGAIVTVTFSARAIGYS